MKVTIDIDCTPEEARTFFGLPDVQPMQKRLMAELEERMHQNIQDLEPEALINKWLPLGLQGMEQMQKAMWAAMSGASSNKKD
ncbi:MAG: DUF6489 family protein [Minwuia sp.]|uniref:DUF6489 family protein n=1 Tax=Minwuia sp. TaxID=2493630 RepID=UPI003A88BC18